MTDEKPLKLSQGQEAYRRILDEVRAGHLMPGDRLMEVELAKRLGFSRTPVREAIRQLESDGVVTHVPRVGAAIRSLDHAEISELYDMRTVLEGTAARFAARAASEVELAELADIHATMAAGEGDPYVLNRQFHAALLDAARNRFLKKAVASIHTTLLILGPTTLREEERAEDALREHAAILEGLQARDQDAAEQAMRAHIAAAHRARLRQLRRG
ncbi:GntR family transcriptional regulator [Mameliella sp.]|uniref:GntR family transcriptional regulator n=1 Tax=Mameliella sp. TaxID=1924940 RepID=UPI003B502DD6